MPHTHPLVADLVVRTNTGSSLRCTTHPVLWGSLGFRHRSGPSSSIHREIGSDVVGLV